MTRGRVVFGGALFTLCALVAAVLSLSAGAAAASPCASLNNVKSYKGSASLSYTRTATGVASDGGNETLTISHSVVNVASSSMSPAADHHFTGLARGGSVAVNDHYSDKNGSTTTTSRQSSSGAIRQNNASITISFVPSTCSYSVSVSYVKASVGKGTFGQDGQVTDSATSSSGIPIPSSLILNGSETVQAYPTTPADVTPGFYMFGAKSSWAAEMARLLGQSDLGPATISWSLTPVFPPQKVCKVPVLAGTALQTARLELQIHNCSPGTVTTERSSTVHLGDVISSNPPAGTTVPAGTKVALVISSGPPPGPVVCTVPKLKKRTFRSAKHALRVHHCKLGKVKHRHSRKIPKGHVISSRPRAGTIHKKGTKVSLTISRGRP